MPNSEPTSPALDRLREQLAAAIRKHTVNGFNVELITKDEAVYIIQNAVRELVPIPPDLHELLRAFACKQLGINRDVSDTVLLKEINGRGVATDAQDTTAGIPSTQPPDAGSRVTPDTEGPPRKDEASLPLKLHHNKDLQEEP